MLPEFCRQPFFDISSPHDQKLTTYDSPIESYYEVDQIEVFEQLQSDKYSPGNEFIIYQQWGPTREDGGRPYFWLDIPTAERLASGISKGFTKNLILVCTMFEPGSIQRFTNVLISNNSLGAPPSLDLLGLFWYFSGDDITDEPENVDDIAYVANKLNIKRLSILTRDFNDECHDRLAENLKENKSLQYFSVFENDDSEQWPRFPTPKIDAITNANR